MKAMKIDPEQERQRLQRQLLKNSEVRNFINEHEIMIQECFDRIFTELSKSKSDKVEKNGKRQARSLSNSNRFQIKEQYITFLHNLYGLENAINPSEPFHRSSTNPPLAHKFTNRSNHPKFTKELS